MGVRVCLVTAARAFFGDAAPELANPSRRTTHCPGATVTSVRVLEELSADGDDARVGRFCPAASSVSVVIAVEAGQGGGGCCTAQTCATAPAERSSRKARLSTRQVIDYNEVPAHAHAHSQAHQ